MSKKKKKGFRVLSRFGNGNRHERKNGMEDEKVITNPEMEEEEAAPNEAEQPAEETEKQEAESETVSAEELISKLQAAIKERDEYLDLARRQKAEFANYKRRTEGIRKDAYDESRRDTIEAFLPVLDNLERALAVSEENALTEGVKMVYRQMVETLTKMGVEEINPEGEMFDAMLMNAVLQGTPEEGEQGTVCQVLQKGYKLGDHVIRHAMVKVVAG
ncbi:MAG: nucleotide exchange factor GrpE [Clostridia bacterium]|nr:nucleotide exchange factor GrpE [Clostridia bacterium]